MVSYHIIVVSKKNGFSQYRKEPLPQRGASKVTFCKLTLNLQQSITQIVIHIAGKFIIKMLNIFPQIPLIGSLFATKFFWTSLTKGIGS